MSAIDPTDPTSFLYAGNQVYIAQLYERYLDDPGSVDSRWQEFFTDLEDEARMLNQEQRGASWSPSDARIIGEGSLTPLSEQMAPTRQDQPEFSARTTSAVSSTRVREATLDSIRTLMLIRAYRVRGHL